MLRAGMDCADLFSAKDEKDLKDAKDVKDAKDAKKKPSGGAGRLALRGGIGLFVFLVEQS